MGDIGCVILFQCIRKPVFLEKAKTKLPNDTKIEPMTASTFERFFLNNTTMDIANTSHVDHTADVGLLESNPGTDDKKTN